MSRKPKDHSEPAAAPVWTPEELVAVRHLGPAIIGPEMYAAKEAYVARHGSNTLGPATRGE